MKRIIPMLVVFILALSAYTVVFAEPQLPDIQVGRLLYTDISAYINHYPIPAYATDTGVTAIKMRDLENFGFEVGWDEEKRMAILNIKSSENNATDIKGIDNVEKPSQKPGILFSKYTYGDVKAYLNGVEIPVYLSDSSSYICFEDLCSVGEVVWCPDIMAIKLWVETLPMTDYAEIQKSTLEPKPMIASYAKYNNYDSCQKSWWFIKKYGSSEISYSVLPIIADHKVIFRDTARPKKIYLTFDEGYEAGYTNQILDTLNKYNIPATFFITGDYLSESPDLVYRMLENGYGVGNHTHKHPNLADIASQSVAHQLSEVNNKFADMFGMNMEYMRPPEGSYSSRVLQIADDMGYKTVFWSFAYNDWDTSNQKGSDYAFSQITPYLHDGAVMLLHASSSDNTSVLDRLIAYIIEQGYTFGSLNDIWV